MKRKVILITDGDEYAQAAVEYTAKQFGGRCISQSAGNPTMISGDEMVNLVLQAPNDPVFLMFDDSGLQGEGYGEKALKFVASHPQIEVLGVIAVAAKTHHSEWTRIDVSIDRELNLTEYGVDKSGLPDIEIGRLNGDTVYCLDQLDVPIIVGVGDIGKMSRRDSVSQGCPVTKRAVEIIMERSE
jgi:stage V sporulation protein AE